MSYKNIANYDSINARRVRESGETVNLMDWLIDGRSTTSDQAGRSRSSLPVALGDYKLLRNRLPNFFDTVTNGTATVEYNATLRSHKMQTVADGDWAIVQTYQAHNYFAGKSQFVEETLHLGA